MKDTRVDTHELTPMARAPEVAVIDLPPDMAAADMSMLIEEKSKGMYLLAVVPWPGTGARAFFRKHALVTKRESNDANRAKYANPDGLDEAAEEIIRRFPTMKLSTLADKLARAGIVRSEWWIYHRKKKIARHSLARQTKAGNS